MADAAEEKKGNEPEAMITADGQPAAGAEDQPPRFVIKKWNAVAMWSWDICADTCAICRNSLNEPSIEYQVRAPRDGRAAARGRRRPPARAPSPLRDVLTLLRRPARDTALSFGRGPRAPAGQPVAEQ